MVVLLMIACTAFAIGAAASSKPFGFGRIYEPATLSIIALLIVLPLANVGITAQVALSSTANYIFNLMVWGMLAYIVFQAQGNALRVFCAGNAALATGSIVGVLLSNALHGFGIGEENFMAVCLALALVAIIASLFIFPEHKMNELLLPIDEAEFEPSEQDADPFAPWKGACHELAEAGGLTEREEEVFTLFARGKTTQQVADALVISPYTVRAHTRNIYAKLDVHSRTELSNLVEKRVKG